MGSRPAGTLDVEQHVVRGRQAKGVLAGVCMPSLLLQPYRLSINYFMHFFCSAIMQQETSSVVAFYHTHRITKCVLGPSKQ